LHVGVGPATGSGSIANVQLTVSPSSRSTLARADALSTVVPPSGSVQDTFATRQPAGIWAVTGHGPKSMSA
jgi:hypothetical protein